MDLVVGGNLLDRKDVTNVYPWIRQDNEALLPFSMVLLTFLPGAAARSVVELAVFGGGYCKACCRLNFW